MQKKSQTGFCMRLYSLFHLLTLQNQKKYTKNSSKLKNGLSFPQLLIRSSHDDVDMIERENILNDFAFYH